MEIGEVIERIEDSAGDGGRERDGDAARAGICASWECVRNVGQNCRRRFFPRRNSLLDAEGFDGDGLLKRVGLFIGESLGGDDGVAGDAGADAPIDEGFAACGDGDFLGLAGNDFEAGDVE